MSAPASGLEAAGPPAPAGGGLLARPYRTATIGVLLVVTLLAFEQMAVGAAMPVVARDLHGLRLYAWWFSAVAIARLVAEHLGWRWVFLGLVPLVPLAALMLAPVLRGTGAGAAMPRGRAVAAAALAVGAGLLLWSLGRRSPLALAAVPGLAALAYGLRVLLPRGALRLRRGLPATIAMRGLLMGTMAGGESFIPLALISRHGFTPTEAGGALTAGALGWCTGSWWQDRFPDGERTRFAVAGAALLAAGVAAVTAALYAYGPLVVPAWFLAGTGMGMAFPALGVQVLNLSAPAEQGVNSSALQISDGLGSSLAIGVAGALVNLTGLFAAFACALTLAVVAALAAHRVERTDA